jgi:hypothetical protein
MHRDSSKLLQKVKTGERTRFGKHEDCIFFSNDSLDGGKKNEKKPKKILSLSF